MEAEATDRSEKKRINVGKVRELKTRSRDAGSSQR